MKENRQFQRCCYCWCCCCKNWRLDFRNRMGFPLYCWCEKVMGRFLLCSFCTGNRTARTTANQNGQGDHIENIPPQSQLPTKTPSIRNTSRMSVVQPAPPPAAAVIQTTAANPTGRRSYVVKEVERLKENREKRRAQQAEMKEQKNALMNMDPGNPNWELAAMIRYVIKLTFLFTVVNTIFIKPKRMKEKKNVCHYVCH